jgi:hypothetical protein
VEVPGWCVNFEAEVSRLFRAEGLAHPASMPIRSNRGENVMFRKLFAARPCHSPVIERSFRPELESLENRLAPAFVGAGSFPDDLMGNLPTTGPTGLAPIPSGTSASFGFTGSTTAGFLMPFGSASAGSSLTPVATSITSGTPSGPLSTSNQLAQLQQSIGPLFQMAAAQNSAAATSLVINEFLLAVETFTFFQSEEHGVFSPNFQDLPARENAINQNPLLLTPVGRLLGVTVFEATADLIASTQNGAGTAV